MMLKGHIFKKMMACPGYKCLQECNQDVRWQSFNYVISQNMCELNDRTKEARPEDFVPNSDRYHYGRTKNRGEVTLVNNFYVTEPKFVGTLCVGESINGGSSLPPQLLML